MTRGRNFTMLLEVRLKSLLLHLSCIIAFVIMFLVAMINGYC